MAKYLPNNQDKFGNRNYCGAIKNIAWTIYKLIDETCHRIVAFHEGLGRDAEGNRVIVMRAAIARMMTRDLLNYDRCSVWPQRSPSRVHPSGITMANQIDAPLSCVRVTAVAAACFNYIKSDRRHVGQHAQLVH